VSNSVVSERVPTKNSMYPRADFEVVSRPSAKVLFLSFASGYLVQQAWTNGRTNESTHINQRIASAPTASRTAHEHSVVDELLNVPQRRVL
jgi:hypothetical protein